MLLCCFAAVQVSAICQLLAEVQHLSKQQLQFVSLHSIGQLKLQATQLRSKLHQHVKQLQASDPLYQQIPYLGAAMEQVDCTVPAAAWRRAAKQNVAAGQDPLLGDTIISHAVGVDNGQLEQLQAAFAQLDSMLVDPAILEGLHQTISKAEAVLQRNMQLSSWLRAIAVCKQLEAGLPAPAELAADRQMLASELAALCAVLSPDQLAVQLQQHNLSGSGSSPLPPSFLLQLVSGFAAYRKQQLQCGGTEITSYAAVADICQSLQQIAEGSNMVGVAGTLVGQFELLQLLYRQKDALTGTISSGTARCSAILAPMGLLLLDAAVLVAPKDTRLLLKLTDCLQAQHLPSAVAGTSKKLMSEPGAASFVYRLAGGTSVEQPQQQRGVAGSGVQHAAQLEVFQTSAWLAQWQQGLAALKAVADSTGPTRPALNNNGTSLQGQLAAAVALAAACAAAAGCSSTICQQLQDHAVVRTSSKLVDQQQQQLAELEAQQRAAQNAVAKIQQSA